MKYSLNVLITDDRSKAAGTWKEEERSRTDSTSAVALPDFDGAVISVFTVAVILLVVGQAVVVCRKRHRRSCQRRCRKWNVPVFNQLNGLSSAACSAGPAINSPPPSEVWTALPPSPLSDLFHADNYRTAAFAYINRRSIDSLPSTAAVASHSSSSASASSSTAAIFVRGRGGGSSVTWTDVGEVTSSSPEKRPSTSLSLSSSTDGEAAESGVPDAGEKGRPDGGTAAPEDDRASSLAADDDVIVTSSASISCSHSLRSVCDDDAATQSSAARGNICRRSSVSVEQHATPCRRMDHVVSFDVSEPPSPTSLSNASTDVHYIELTTDYSTAHADTDNSTC